jgi:hypothetical protein
MNSDHLFAYVTLVVVTALVLLHHPEAALWIGSAIGFGLGIKYLINND